MEETDGIIVETLRRLGCDFEENVTCLSDFTTETVIEGVVKCLSQIQPSTQINHRLPPQLPARYKLCMDIAKACNDIGLKGELGYETFLHGSHAEIRNIFIVLIQKLPRANEQPIQEGVDPFQQTISRIKSEVGIQVNRPWVPHFCCKPAKCHLFNSVDISHPRYYSSKSAFSNLSSLPCDKLTSSLLEKDLFDLAVEKYNFKITSRSQKTKQTKEKIAEDISTAFGLIKLLNHSDLAQKQRVKPQLPPKPTNLKSKETSEPCPPTQDEQKQQLSLEVSNLAQELKIKEKNLVSVDDEVDEIQLVIERTETDIKAEEKELERKEKLCTLLSDASSHLERIYGMLESNKQKLSLMEQEWEDIKKPLEDEYQEWHMKKNNTNIQQMKLTIEQTSTALRAIVEEIRTKEDSISKLQSQLENLPASTLTRSFYTQRLLNIVANVKKQDEEMLRVIEDVKSVQRENNALLGKVERTFTVTDEIIFRMAQSDETARRIYKYFISLHSDCTDILRLVEEVGSFTREIKALEEQVETEARKNVRSKLKQMRSDLEQIRLENQSLESQFQPAHD